MDVTPKYPALHAISTVLAGSVIACVTVGCQSGYTLAVKNHTDQPVTVTVVETLGVQAGVSRASKWLGPGDSATLGPGVSDRSARIELVADSKANTFAPAVALVEPGWTSYDIKRTNDGRLKLVQRNQQ